LSFLWSKSSVFAVSWDLKLWQQCTCGLHSSGMFYSDIWWFLTNDLGVLVSNKSLVDAVTHCRIAKISCIVFFKTTSLPRTIYLFSRSIGRRLQVGTIFFPPPQHKSPILFFWYTQIKIVGGYVSYRFLRCHPSCGMQRDPLIFILFFLLLLFLLMLLMHHSTLLFICTKNMKINFLYCLLFIQAFCMVYYFLASLQVVFLSFPLAASC
jgi:hypothetical protein